MIGLIGRGPWANVWKKTLDRMEVDCIQVGRDYHGLRQLVSGVIVASAAESHADIAGTLIAQGVPCIVEKPLCLTAAGARALLADVGEDSIVFVNHSRLFSNHWREFKAEALEHGVHRVYASAGGPCKIDPHFDWGSHLVAMCCDLGFDPQQATFTTSRERSALEFVVNNRRIYRDEHESPTPLEVLTAEFLAAIEKGEKNVGHLELGVRVIEFLEGAQHGRDNLTIGHPLGQAGTSAEAGTAAAAAADTGARPEA